MPHQYGISIKIQLQDTVNYYQQQSNLNSLSVRVSAKITKFMPHQYGISKKNQLQATINCYRQQFTVARMQNSKLYFIRLLSPFILKKNHSFCHPFSFLFSLSLSFCHPFFFIIQILCFISPLLLYPCFGWLNIPILNSLIYYISCLYFLATFNHGTGLI